MDFITVTPRHTIHRAVQLTEENLPEAAESLNGKLENGILSFTISNHTLYGMAGDWLVIFGTDVHIFTDKYYQRNYDPVELTTNW
ncbi:Hypothetical Protein OBI_RACECAR_138 [Arthrobacter phage Racecar]|nr:hypothetical protein PBI_RACECAR_220 [Arthrobacter phage Racecar]